MRWIWTAAIALGVAVGAMAAMSVQSFKNGVYYSPYSFEEKVEFESGPESGRFVQYRIVAHIPPEYGKLVAITDGGVLWFEDQSGFIRNVAVESSRSLVIQRKGRLTITEK